MSAAYFNTTNARGATLERYEREAQSQEERLVALFEKHAPLGITPSQAHRALDTRAPLTSIRRAISNLAKRGVLTRTHDQTAGPYGRLEFKWKLRTEPKQPRLL